ncbi:hypothetical protein NQ176_g1955 [Zarea fungicola]|uniref:Uncharacterized protein n=1 Tax=Zarea fungicola TaxID=93591 RepID=A0ACC1NRL8_9HYPO|nr:hypothetical protein NQ176_g1955 [Lecanicillium fungicola]
MKVSSSLWPYLALLSSHVPSVHGNGGLIGLGLDFFHPRCGYACLNSISSPLNCPVDEGTGKETLSIDNPAKHWEITHNPTKECKFQDTFYLQTLAYCLQQYCHKGTSVHASLSEQEDFWRNAVQGNTSVSVPSYDTVVHGISEVPTAAVDSTRVLDYTGYVPESGWSHEDASLATYKAIEANHQIFGLIIFLTCAIIPILLSSIRFLPWPPTFVSKFRGYVIDPPLLGSRHSEPIHNLFMVPTRGQALFILYLWGINMLLVGVGYHCNTGSTCVSANGLSELNRLRAVANRLGVLSFANLPLLILFAGRNNIILWLTNWSRTTFLFIHRYVAFIAMAEGVLHFALFMYIAARNLSSAELLDLSRKPYYICGLVAVVSLIVLIITGFHPLRNRTYEVFVVLHIFFTILVLVGTYVHTITRFGTKRGHETWLYLATAIWVFDRVLRALRYLSRGVKTAYISPIDEDYIRVDIPGVSARGHVYLHFLTVSKWRLWESHPFSVGSITSWQEDQAQVDAMAFRKSFSYFEKALNPGLGGGRKQSVSASRMPSVSSCADSLAVHWMKGTGITLLIRRQSGITTRLRDPTLYMKGIPVLVEGSYNEEMTRLQDDHIRPTAEFPNMICIAGGVGITGALPFLDKFEADSGQFYTKKLFWVVRSMPLVNAVEDMLITGQTTDAAERQWGDVDVTLCVGPRPNLSFTMHRMLYRQSGGTIVVVCGPPAMADEVRCFISRIARKGGYGESKMKVKVIVECFSW